MNSTRPKMIKTINNHEALESAITAALEQPQSPAIPSDFAARVAARAATLPQRSRSARPHYARSVSIFLTALLVVALFLLAPHAQPSFASIGFDIELSLLVLLSTLVYWLTQARNEPL